MNNLFLARRETDSSSTEKLLLSVRAQLTALPKWQRVALTIAILRHYLVPYKLTRLRAVESCGLFEQLKPAGLSVGRKTHGLA